LKARLIEHPEPSISTSGYYTGVLEGMVNLSEFASKRKDSKIPRPMSREKVDWKLLDSRPEKKPNASQA